MTTAGSGAGAGQGDQRTLEVQRDEDSRRGWPLVAPAWCKDGAAGSVIGWGGSDPGPLATCLGQCRCLRTALPGSLRPVLQAVLHAAAGPISPNADFMMSLRTPSSTLCAQRPNPACFPHPHFLSALGESHTTWTVLVHSVP